MTLDSPADRTLIPQSNASPSAGTAHEIRDTWVWEFSEEAIPLDERIGSSSANRAA
jgi:hypothetical protein